MTFYETLGGKKGAQRSEAGPVETKNKTSEIPAGQTAPPAEVRGDGSCRRRLPAMQRVKPTPRFPAVKADGTKQTPAGRGSRPGRPGCRSRPFAGRDPKGKAARPKGRFEVQVAAYRERRQAEQLVKKLKALGFSPQVVMKDSRQGEMVSRDRGRFRKPGKGEGGGRSDDREDPRLEMRDPFLRE